jgi:hypothetical protein
VWRRREGGAEVEVEVEGEGEVVDGDGDGDAEYTNIIISMEEQKW